MEDKIEFTAKERDTLVQLCVHGIPKHLRAEFWSRSLGLHAFKENYVDNYFE